MIDLSERPMYPEIGNCDLFSDARRKTCYERGTISITYSKRLSIFPLQTGSKRYPCEFAFQRRKVTPSIIGPLVVDEQQEKRLGTSQEESKIFILKSLDLFIEEILFPVFAGARFCQ